MIIRRADPSEAELLSAIAFRSKGHWPYDRGALEAYRPHLEVFPEEIARGWTFAGELDSHVVGFYSLASESGRERLDFMFVEPEHIGRGFGELLWTHALQTARSRGWSALSFSADVHAAEGFYAARGCASVGSRDSDLGLLVEMRISLG